MGCNGGWLNVAWDYLQSHGIPTLSCVSYKSGGGNTGTCPTACDDGSAPVFYKATKLESLDDPSDIQKAII